ncbi:MAG: Uma2 family endonuclease [Kofleriaceae bacterium]
MATAIQAPPDVPDVSTFEHRFLLHGVPWWTYVALRDALDDQSGLKMTYLKGTLELLSPSTLHEDAKKIIARLLEVWAMERDVDLRGFGGATFRREAKERGLEPDECYKLGKLEDDDVPDLAIEVIVSSGLVDKMDVYAGLAVPEVWEWRPSQRTVIVHRLVAGVYERHDHSTLLSEVDLALLSSFVQPGENQTRLAKAYQKALRGG